MPNRPNSSSFPGFFPEEGPPAPSPAPSGHPLPEGEGLVVQSARDRSGIFSPLPPGEGAGVRASASGHKDIPAEIIAFARRLRRCSTDAEALIWGLLRDRRFGGFKFRRQHPLPPYVADFYCHESRLCVELDGGQHSDRDGYDLERDARLKSHGILTLRFWNDQVFKETENVLASLWQALHERHSRPSFEKETRVRACAAPSPGENEPGARAHQRTPTRQ